MGLALAALLTACASLQPVHKVGVLAPFEGLYRRSGYEALDAARAALEAEAPALAAKGIAAIPLALDTSLDPRRAAAKLLADPALAAVVGPLSPTDAPAMAALLDGAGVPWFAPYAVGPDGFLAPQEGAWAVELARAVAAAAQAQGAARLLVAGWDAAGWPAPQDSAWQAVNQLPLLFVDAGMVAEIGREGDAMLWAGDPVQGAEVLGGVRAAGLAIPFWLGPGSADATFLEHAPASIQATPAGWGEVLWLTWHEIEYNSASDPLLAHAGSPPPFHGPLTGAATRAAIGALSAQHARTVERDGTPRFQPVAYRLAPDGSLAPVAN